jgi:hypothetical protein
MIPFWQPSLREQIKAGVWRGWAVPSACDGVQTMLMDDELRLIQFLADHYFSGKGVIVDAGSFLGGSTLALAQGLRSNLTRRGKQPTRLIHSYDLFQVEDWTRGVYFGAGVETGSSTRAIYDHNIADYADLIEVHEGDITLGVSPSPIEILFIDVAKHWTVSDWIVEHMFARLIPGRSIIIQQDYLYHHWNGWLAVTMEYYADYFEMLCDTEYNSVAFRLKKRFKTGALKPALIASMSMDEVVRLFDLAIARFSGTQADMLTSSKAHLLEMLSEDRRGD